MAIAAVSLRMDALGCALLGFDPPQPLVDDLFRLGARFVHNFGADLLGFLFRVGHQFLRAAERLLRAGLVFGNGLLGLAPGLLRLLQRVFDALLAFVQSAQKRLPGNPPQGDERTQERHHGPDHQTRFEFQQYVVARHRDCPLVAS